MDRKQTYDPHPGVAMVRNWLDTLKEKSGRGVEEWIALVKKKGPASTKDRIAWLKSEHELGTNSAKWIVDSAEGREEVEIGDEATYLRLAEGYVESMFSGPKAALRPIYDALYNLARSFDVRISPAKTIVPIYRNHVIAQIKPTTRTRIDFGLALKDTPAKGRLIDTGGLAKKDRITHRFEITSVKDIDDEVKKCLRKAWEMDR
ncbi:MAG: DUF5655 domain-containing protein [Thermoanaerobaculia bacterium]